MADTFQLPARFADAPRAGHGGVKHTCNGGDPRGLGFGRRDVEHCARCWELSNGAEPRADYAPRRVDRAAEDARRTIEIREHFASEKHRRECGRVCTFGDW